MKLTLFTSLICSFLSCALFHAFKCIGEAKYVKSAVIGYSSVFVLSCVLNTIPTHPYTKGAIYLVVHLSIIFAFFMIIDRRIPCY